MLTSNSVLLVKNSLNLKNIILIFLKNKLINLYPPAKRVFESVVAVVFQSFFYSKIHQNNIFLFLKNYF
jgi:hypothetical protein